MIFIYIIVAILLLIGLLLLDFSLGKKNHRKNVRFLDFESTTGDYQIYTAGDPLFEDLFQDLRHAKKKIDMMFFIIKTDEISRELLEILKQKAEEGLQVRLLLDRIGSYRINSKVIKELNQSGVEFAFSEKPKFPYFFYRSQRRNHRKITIIDGDVGYIGGFNVGREYLGKDAELGNWRDYHLRLLGDIVQHLQSTFFDDWYLATGHHDEEPVPTETEGEKWIEIAATDGVQLEDVFESLICQAKEEVFIGTPYFIPSERLFKCLTDALERGVNVKVIVPMKADHPLVKEAGLPYMMRLIDAGGEVYMFDQGFYHAKVVIVDQQLCDIGTANFDRRSLFLNKEVNTIIHNPRFVMDLRLAFLKDVQDSEPLNDHLIQLFTIRTKIKIGIARFFRPLL
ncbi:cardiolipin synthase [Pontibacillus salipaludis]|uniref:Cardiolipin synthase n=1 Tax=Pontibacillus salipaludis TaxID=1697394 RepID=A0ABQ1PPI6_9BACI|nr:cardiolipin synthase [Pontibacillus salipaludis]GGD00875.1 cardiolipin synthase [Pontibacillus salipaludis]